jgi:hypothetical protein
MSKLLLCMVIFLNLKNNVGINSTSCNVNSEGEGGKLKTLASNANKLEEPYRSMVLRKAYAQIIAEYRNIGLPPELKNFLHENAEKGFAKLAEIDYLISHPLADFPILEQEITTLSSSIQEKIPEYLAYQKTLDDLTFVEHLSNNYLPTNGVVAEIQSLSEQLGGKIHIADSIRLTHWQLANTMNNNLFIENQYIDLEQQINTIYLNLLINNQVIPNFDDSMLIKTIAFYCPQEFGDAVIKARVMWVLMGNAVDKTWDKCFPTGKSESSQNRNTIEERKGNGQIVKDTDKPIAYPVPLSDNLMVSLPFDYVGAEFEVFNAVGISVKRGIFKEITNAIDATTWNNGIFYISIKAKDKHPITLKVIVQKL